MKTRQTRSLFSIAVALQTMLACSGGGGALDSSSSGNASSSGGAVDPAQCRNACAHLTTCKEKAEGICSTTGDCGPLVGYLKAEFRDGYLGCVADLATACKALENCVAAGGARVTPGTDDTAFANACNSRRKTCAANGGNSFSDDHCSDAIAFVPAAVSKLNACLSQECATIGKCLDDAVTK